MTDLTAVQQVWLKQILDTVEAAFPDLIAEYPEDTWWQPVGPMQPCECCGTPVFLAQDTTGARRWCQVGDRPAHVPCSGGLAVHTPERCDAQRDLLVFPNYDLGKGKC